MSRYPSVSPLPISIFTAALLSSSPASAALVSCATSSNPTMCSLCDVFVTGNTIVNYFSGILLPIALVTLTFGGILYLMNRVDQAKSIITASVLGIILSLSAFLIVNLTMRALSIPQTDWNTFTCTAQVAATPPKTDGTTFNTTGDGGPKDTVGNPGDITGDPTVTPTTPICNENRDTSNIPMTLPLSLTLNCTNPDQIVSAIWRFPSDSNFGSQNVNNKDGITFTSIDNPSNWTEVTVVVTDTKGRGQTYTYGLGTTVAAGGDDELYIVTSLSSDPDAGRGTGTERVERLLAEDPQLAGLNWADLCAKRVMAKEVGDYRQFEPVYDHGGPKRPILEVYPVTVPDDPNWALVFSSVALAPADWVQSHLFISDTPCPATAPHVYTWYSMGGVIVSLGEDRPDAPSSVQLKPGRWYFTLLWNGVVGPEFVGELEFLHRVRAEWRVRPRR